MEGADDLNSNSTSTDDHHTSSRPSVGFPVGTALLLVVIFCISGAFSCCYHWEKIRSLAGRRRHRRPQPHENEEDDDVEAAAQSRRPPLFLHNTFVSLPSPMITPNKLPFKLQDEKQEKSQSLPVIMAGDEVPRFMAWPCPCPCPNTEKKIVVVVCSPPINISSQSTPPPNL